MKWILMLMLLLSVSCMISCHKENSNTLKFMTFNIRYGTANDDVNSWDYRKEILIDCLKKYQPDILGTQESLEFQIDFINAAFPKWRVFGVGRYHNVFEPDRSHESMAGESCKIFYDTTKFELVNEGTYWHSDTPEVAGSKTWGNDLPRITTWGILRFKSNYKQFVVMNTHFHWDEPYVSNTTSLIMREWREIADTSPTILMGDFNLEPTSWTHDVFCGIKGKDDIRGNFRDCWQVLGKSEENAGTSHRFNGSRSRGRIDWMLVTAQFEVKSIKIIHDKDHGRYPSDHYPVMAEIRLFSDL